MPTDIELDSLAVLLHSFYNGVERILVLISKDSETFANIEQMTANWHQSLLLSYNSDDNSQRFSLPEELTNRLLDYLKFRHMFRHAYSFELKWTRMQHLVAGLNQAFIDFLSTLKGYYNF